MNKREWKQAKRVREENERIWRETTKRVAVDIRKGFKRPTAKAR